MEPLIHALESRQLIVGKDNVLNFPALGFTAQPQRLSRNRHQVQKNILFSPSFLGQVIYNMTPDESSHLTTPNNHTTTTSDPLTHTDLVHRIDSFLSSTPPSTTQSKVRT